MHDHRLRRARKAAMLVSTATLNATHTIRRPVADADCGGSMGGVDGGGEGEVGDGGERSAVRTNVCPNPLP